MNNLLTVMEGGKPFPSEDQALATMSQASRMLAEAVTFEDFRSLRDQATAAKAWARARGMGIEAENLAAEYIIRAERGMGRLLMELRQAGMYGNTALSSAQTRDQKRLMDLAVRMRDDEVWTLEQIAVLCPDLTTAQLSDALGPSDLFANMGYGKWAVNAEELARREQRTAVTREDLALSGTEAARFQQLVRQWSDAAFEERLGTLKLTGARLAKMDFYRGPKSAEKRQKQALSQVVEAMQSEGETPVLAAFERAASALLHTMSTLPDDELLRVAVSIRSLADAYNAAREARMGRA